MLIAVPAEPSPPLVCGSPGAALSAFSAEMVRIGVHQRYEGSGGDDEEPARNSTSSENAGGGFLHSLRRMFRCLRKSKVEDVSYRSRIGRGWEEIQSHPDASLLSEVLQLLPDAICVLDDRHTVLYANDIFFDAAGIPGDALSAKLSIVNAIFVNQQIPQRITELIAEQSQEDRSASALANNWLSTEAGNVNAYSWVMKYDAQKPLRVIYGRFVFPST